MQFTESTLPGTSLTAIDTTNAFRSVFNQDPEQEYFSPGRVNLIGEHTDYNGGLVLPVAISLGTHFAVAKCKDSMISVVSSLEPEPFRIKLDEIETADASGGWCDYVLGTLKLLKPGPGSTCGLNIYITSDLPVGSGLSSSASFTCGLMTVIADNWALSKTPLDIALLAKEVENEFIGVSCGIMDQFAVTHGKKDHAIALDCNSLEYAMVPLKLIDTEILIVDSRVNRSLSASEYNRRREECDRAFQLLNSNGDYKNLCDVPVEVMQSASELKDNPLLLKRARHAIEENLRVRRATGLLTDSDFKKFGLEMTASHASLRDDYEVSCPELDLLVDIALADPGVFGTRMTGAGFGGCTVTLLKSDAFDRVSESILEIYTRETGITPNLIRCQTGNGTGRKKDD